MKESDILHQNGNYWVCADKVKGIQKGNKFSFPGYKIYKCEVTHSIEVGFSFVLDRAIAICNNFAKNKK